MLFCFPETAGLALEEVKIIFRDGFGIKASQRLRQSKRDMKANRLAKNEEKENGTP